MARHEKRTFGVIGMIGSPRTLTTHSVTVLAVNALNQPIMCSGANIPHDADVGFATGCMFVKSDTGAIYFNVGTAASANFDLQGVVAALSVTDAELAANSVITTKILNANVTLAKLAAGITPSHVIKFAGSSAAEVDADAAVVITVTGAVAATDVATAVLRAAANDVYIKKVTLTNDTLTVTLSGNGGAGTVVDYMVVRAAA